MNKARQGRFHWCTHVTKPCRLDFAHYFNNIDKVYTYLSPDIEYFHGRHLPYFIVAILCLRTFHNSINASMPPQQLKTLTRCLCMISIFYCPTTISWQINIGQTLDLNEWISGGYVLVMFFIPVRFRCWTHSKV